MDPFMEGGIRWLRFNGGIRRLDKGGKGIRQGGGLGKGSSFWLRYIFNLWEREKGREEQFGLHLHYWFYLQLA
jgi:hypothetical protein